jgi:hypothetical protein
MAYPKWLFKAVDALASFWNARALGPTFHVLNRLSLEDPAPGPPCLCRVSAVPRKVPENQFSDRGF